MCVYASLSVFLRVFVCLCMLSFVFILFYSGYFYSAFFKSITRTYSEALPEFHAEAPQTTASEGLVQGPYFAARAEFKPMTLRTIGVESTNEPPRSTQVLRQCVYVGVSLYLEHRSNSPQPGMDLYSKFNVLLAG